MVVFELRPYRRTAAVDEAMVVFELRAYRRAAVVEEAKVAVVSRAHVASHSKTAVDELMVVVVEPQSQVDASACTA